MNAVVGNTIDFDVEIDEISDNPTEIWLELYRTKEYGVTQETLFID